MVFVLEIAFFAGVSCTKMAVLRHPGRTFLDARTHGKLRMLIFAFAHNHNSLRLLFDLLQIRELPSFVRFRLTHCSNNYFKESARKWAFLIQNNECLNIVQSIFHAVISLFYTYSDFRPQPDFHFSFSTTNVFILSECKHFVAISSVNIFRRECLPRHQ